MNQLPISEQFKDDTLKTEFWTRDTIAHVYDRLHQVRLNDLYETIAMIALKTLNLVAQSVNIETTSIHRHSTNTIRPDKEMISKVNVKYGYKANRD